ncbi:MAG: hypothetical protein ABFD79_02220 [Phycisphaerales bacterium]
MRKLGLLLFFALTVGFMQGCAQPKQIAPEPKCLSGTDLEAAMKASEFTLVKMNFVIDKSDANLAVMTTKPLTGAQFFEFWRKDNVGRYNTAFSSIHTLRRTVELGFTPGQGQTCIVCKVKTEMLSIPEKEIDSAGRAYSMFSKSDDTELNLALNEEQRKKMDWIDMGRDNLLEKSILDRIEKQILKTTIKNNK